MFSNIPPAEEFKSAQFPPPFSERLGKLRKKSLKIAFYYDYPDRSTFRYRVENLIEAFEYYSKDISSAYFCHSDGDQLTQIVNYCDIIVFVRARYTIVLESIIIQAKRLGRRVFYDIDDMVYDIKYIPTIMQTSNVSLDDEKNWDYWFSYVSRLWHLMNMCDEVTVTNDFLAKKVLSIIEKPVHVIPNTISKIEIDYAKKIMESKLKAKFASSNSVNIGYFSGSPSHDKDFAITADAIIRIMEEDRNLSLTVVGYLNIDPKFEKFQTRVKRFSLQNEINLMKIVGSTEINIIPLQLNDFTNCKSELKFFEAGAVGTLSLASPSYTLKAAMSASKTGRLVSEVGWYAALREEIYTLRHNKNEYKNQAICAHEYCCSNFSSEILYHAARRAYLGNE